MCVTWPKVAYTGSWGQGEGLGTSSKSESFQGAPPGLGCQMPSGPKAQSLGLEPFTTHLPEPESWAATETRPSLEISYQAGTRRLSELLRQQINCLHDEGSSGLWGQFLTNIQYLPDLEQLGRGQVNCRPRKQLDFRLARTPNILSSKAWGL